MKQPKTKRCAWCGHRFSPEGLQRHRNSEIGRWACQANSVVLPPLRQVSDAPIRRAS